MGTTERAERARILVVDDEESITQLLCTALRYEGFETASAATGKEALREADAFRPDLVLLDVMLPDLDGFEVHRRLTGTTQPRLPVVFLTARRETDDRVRGLTIGADDYVTKPFRPRELLARVRAVLRRKGANEVPEVCELEFGPLVIDGRRHEVRVDGRDAHVTRKEFQLLLTMAKEPGKAFSRLELLEKAFGYNYEGLERTIDAHIRNLRKKIERDAERPTFIETVYGLGYRFAEYRDAP